MSRDTMALHIFQALIVQRGEDSSAKGLAANAYDLADALIAEGLKRKEEQFTKETPKRSIDGAGI